MAINLYETLGISKDAAPEQIRAAYIKRSKETHPDAVGGSTEAFQDVALAYEVLKSTERRAHYDATGNTGGANSQPTVEEMAVIMVAALFDAFLETQNHHDLTLQAIPKMLVGVHMSDEMASRKIQDMNLELSRLIKFASRLTRYTQAEPPVPQDILQDALRSRQEAMKARIAGMERIVQVNKLARDILSSYQFQSDPRPPIAQTADAFNAAASYQEEVNRDYNIDRIPKRPHWPLW